ncbi:SMIM5 protein, partial [Centropus bengalensis]|nr:SMIM5 protein [Centropus bengalensis]
MSSQGLMKEMHTLGEKFLLKLQKLPTADPVEIVSFFVVLLFILTVLVLLIIACSCCCYSCCSRDERPDHSRWKTQARPIAH